MLDYYGSTDVNLSIQHHQLLPVSSRFSMFLT